MADALADLQQRLADARTAAAWLTQAAALKASPADVVVFTCANPPYAGLLVVGLPRSVWGPALDQAIADAQAKVDSLTNLATGK